MDRTDQVHPPPVPASMRQDGTDKTELIAFWAPMLHLLVFGLGWRRPDLGLERWYETGEPPIHPALSVFSRWWGPHIEDVLAWAAASTKMAAAGESLLTEWQPSDDRRVQANWLASRRDDRNWLRVWGGDGDALHLSDHAKSPRWDSPEPTYELVTGPNATARATLLCDTYQGWYHALSHCGLAQTRYHRSWQVDVIVKPLGWLGTYRLSRDTGAWFSGRHKFHLWGW
ncbi:hypothetical protein [Actinoplanes sp. NPDC023714]|uniref:hypothetical protein n=1 Tax=Actinoplanes sp. NPDC023714 TaxID=3154322 RepID=UPI0033D97A77